MSLVIFGAGVAKGRTLPEVEAEAGIAAATTKGVTTGIQVECRSRGAL
jgi:hypothetical protein